MRWGPSERFRRWNERRREGIEKRWKRERDRGRVRTLTDSLGLGLARPGARAIPLGPRRRISHRAPDTVERAPNTLALDSARKSKHARLLSTPCRLPLRGNSPGGQANQRAAPGLHGAKRGVTGCSAAGAGAVAAAGSGAVLPVGGAGRLGWDWDGRIARWEEGTGCALVCLFPSCREAKIRFSGCSEERHNCRSCLPPVWSWAGISTG